MCESLHCVCPEVVVELVHVNQGSVGFPAVTGLAKSSPSNLEFEGGSAIAAPTVSDDGLDDVRCVGPLPMVRCMQGRS